VSSDEERHLPKWRKLDGVTDARRRQMRAVRTLEKVMYEAFERGDTEEARKAAAVLTNAVRCYLSAVELDELEGRLEAVENAVEVQKSVRRN
jgi:hypothetical protein